jgi:Kdo2-lipid IVA lauroyltransferase/acyltransferase
LPAVANRFKNNIVYIGARILFRLVNMLPRRFTLWLGETLGAGAYRIIKKERLRALGNLDIAFGDSITAQRKQEIVRGCFVTFGRATIEAMRFRRHYHKQIKPQIEVVGEEHLKRAYERGKGVVVFTAHIGNFELLAAHVAQMGYKAAAIGREVYDKRLDKMLVENRAAMGLVNIRTDDSPRTIMRLLKEGYVIGFLIDTDSWRVAGEYTPYFGRPARTPIGPTQLGLISGAAFLPMFCLSFPGGRYRIICGEELAPESYDRSRENVYRVTCKMTEVIERTVREYPEQWIWMHDRWRSRQGAGSMLSPE